MVSSSSLFKFIALIAIIAVQAVLAAPRASAPNANTVKAQALAAHNKYRTKHHVPKLKWSVKLAEHARTVTTSCVWGHNVMKGTGQNIAYGYPSMKAVVDAWYKEVSNYDYASGQSLNGKVTGHFTQVVWKGTTEVGCAATYCSNLKATYYVCDYSPPGNYYGEYTKNVFKP